MLESYWAPNRLIMECMLDFWQLVVGIMERILARMTTGKVKIAVPRQLGFVEIV